MKSNRKYVTDHIVGHTVISARGKQLTSYFASIPGHLILQLSLCLIIIHLILTGCSTSVKRYAHPSLDFSHIKRIAVMPLDNLTDDKFAGRKLTGIVIMELLSRGFDVIEPGEVSLALKKARVSSFSRVPKDLIIKIARELYADAIITGSVGTYKRQKGITVIYPEVSVNLMMISSESGDIIWSVWHTSGGPDFWTRHFGAEGDTLDEVSKKVVKEALDTLF